ncbi:KH domain-containing protein [Candidatus Peregrinibacteria bacterium]|nr:KH domain-containing protein [Candidatus Peregrinibacteria bacterium]
MENKIHEIVQQFIEKIGSRINKIKVEYDQNLKLYKVNIDSTEPSVLIGHKGENINALQHLIRLILWKNNPDLEFDLAIDVDNYKKRQEEKILKMADRKVEMVRKISAPQSLPAMNPYFRRIIHLYLAQEKFNDIRTESHGEGESRYIVIKPQLII